MNNAIDSTDPRAVAPMFVFLPDADDPPGRVRSERDSTCECGNPVHQMQVDRDWLKNMKRERAIRFAREACTIDPDRTIWTPRACPSCERRALNNAPQPTKGGTDGRNTGIKTSDKDNNDRRYGTD